MGHGSDARGLEAAKDIAKDETIFILKPAVLGKTKWYWRQEGKLSFSFGKLLIVDICWLTQQRKIEINYSKLYDLCIQLQIPCNLQQDMCLAKSAIFSMTLIKDKESR